MFIVDLEKGRIVSDEELKNELINKKPYGEWIQYNELHIDDVPDTDTPKYKFEPSTLVERQKAFGYTSEDLRMILAPMIEDGKEPIGSMGADTPLGRFVTSEPAPVEVISNNCLHR
jgi:glutamate synthase (NADPH) large chain